LNKSVKSADPAALAAQIAAILPDPVDPATLAQLVPPAAGPKPSLMQRVTSAFEKTAPARPNIAPPDAVERSSEAARQTSTKEHIVNAPVGQGIDVVRELAKPGPKRAPQPAQKPAPAPAPRKAQPPVSQPSTRPAPDLVITPGMQSRTAANPSMALAALTQALEAQRGANEVTLKLGDEYAKLSAADQASVLQHVENMIPQIATTNPKLLGSVSTITIYVGVHLAKTIQVAGVAR
jgi:hypothetical protein